MGFAEIWKEQQHFIESREPEFLKLGYQPETLSLYCVKQH